MMEYTSENTGELILKLRLFALLDPTMGGDSGQVREIKRTIDFLKEHGAKHASFHDVFEVVPELQNMPSIFKDKCNFFQEKRRILGKDLKKNKKLLPEDPEDWGEVIKKWLETRIPWAFPDENYDSMKNKEQHLDDIRQENMELTREQKIHHLKLCRNFLQGTGEKGMSPSSQLMAAIPEVEKWNYLGIDSALKELELEQDYQDLQDRENEIVEEGMKLNCKQEKGPMGKGFPTIEHIQAVKEIYGVDIYLTKDHRDLVRFDLDEEQFEFETATTLANKQDGAVIILMNPDHTDLNTLSYQCFHAVCRVAWITNKEIGWNEREWAASLMGHLVERSHQFFFR